MMNPQLRDLLRVASRHPGKAAAIAYWFVTRRRVRAGGRLKAAVAALPFAYERWIEDMAARDAATLKASHLGIGENVQNTNPRCELSVHLHVGSGARGALAVSSILAQTWPHWHLIVTLEAPGGHDIPTDPRIRILPDFHASNNEGLRAALNQATTPYLVPLAADCGLPHEALAAYAAWIVSRDGDHLPVIYGDQDEFNANGRRTNPWFKPDWDRDMFLAQDYVSAACALPVAVARHVAALDWPDDARDGPDCASVYALLIRLMIAREQEVCHLYRVTASTPANHWQRICPARLAVLRDTAEPHLGMKASEGAFGTMRIHWPLPDPAPLVSIIIPTRDRLDLLQPCVESVLAHTRYPRFEIVIADNDSVEESAKAFLHHISSDPRVRVISWPHAYNFSAINNHAVRAARGEFLCLLNNDTEIFDGEWLEQLMRQACRPGIGAVGARLLYPDRSIQHAGVAVGMGNAAGHAHRGLIEGDAGYFGHALIARGATAVTAACLVVSRALYEAVDGLDERDLQIAYNDVDFCLKLRALGVQNIYDPGAVLTHHESKSRGSDMAPEHHSRYLKELAVLQQRWDTTRFQDPTHHPVLDRSSERYLTTS